MRLIAFFLLLVNRIYIHKITEGVQKKEIWLIADYTISGIGLCPTYNNSRFNIMSEDDRFNDFMDPQSPQKRVAAEIEDKFDRISISSPTPKKSRTEGMMPDHSCVGRHIPIDNNVRSLHQTFRTNLCRRRPRWFIKLFLKAHRVAEFHIVFFLCILKLFRSAEGYATT